MCRGRPVAGTAGRRPRDRCARRRVLAAAPRSTNSTQPVAKPCTWPNSSIGRVEVARASSRAISKRATARRGRASPHASVRSQQWRVRWRVRGRAMRSAANAAERGPFGRWDERSPVARPADLGTSRCRRRPTDRSDHDRRLHVPHPAAGGRRHPGMGRHHRSHRGAGGRRAHRPRLDVLLARRGRGHRPPSRRRHARPSGVPDRCRLGRHAARRAQRRHPRPVHAGAVGRRHRPVGPQRPSARGPGQRPRRWALP